MGAIFEGLFKSAASSLPAGILLAILGISLVVTLFVFGLIILLTPLTIPYNVVYEPIKKKHSRRAGLWAYWTIIASECYLAVVFRADIYLLKVWHFVASWKIWTF